MIIWLWFFVFLIPVSKDDLQPPVRPEQGVIGLAHLVGGGVAQLEPDQQCHGDGDLGCVDSFIIQVALEF